MEQTVEFAPASGLLSSVWLLVAIPLASAAVLLLLGRRADRWGALARRAASVGAAFVLGADLLLLAARPGATGPVERNLFDFIAVGDLQGRLRAAVRPAGRGLRAC